jgi:hypothetical protein
VGRAVVSVGGAVVQNTVAFVSDPVGYVSDHAADIAHAALGVATFIPGVGAVAALADAGLYVMAGDYGTAAMALAGAIPGGALVRMGGKAARGLRGAEMGARVADDAARIGVEAVSYTDEVASVANQVAKNKAAGDAAADAIASRYEGATREVSRQTAAGTRRMDVYLADQGVGIESKVGRTSLTKRVRSEIAKDRLLLQDPSSGVDHMIWEFSRSATTGKAGPSRALQAALEEGGISWGVHF